MCKLLGTVWLSFVLFMSAFAQTPQRGGEVRMRNERGQVETVKLYEGSYSLIIGAVNYRYWDRLGGVRDDVPAVRAVLEKHGFKVEELIDPTGDNLLPRINKFINEYGLHPNNRLIIYFSGHGYTEVAEDGRKFGYIVPVDAPKPAKDLVGFQQKALTMDEIETAARRIRSKHALFVFDSCFSGTLVNRGGLKVPAVIDYYAARPVRQFITAGADDQEVPAESVFRQVFVRGLEGKADANNDGYVTGTELATYLQDQVIYYRGTLQTPQYGKIRDPRLDSGDFIFTLPTQTTKVTPRINIMASLLQGEEFFNKKDYNGAIAEFTKIIQADPQFAQGYALRGAAYREKGAYDEAIADFNSAIRLDSRNAGVYSNRGLVYSELENYEQAIADFTQAIQLDPKYDKAYHNRGSAYRKLQKYEQATGDLVKAIELNPKNAMYYNQRGLILLLSGNLDQAAMNFDKAIELDAKDADFYANRGLVSIRRNENDRAIADLNKAIQLGSRDEKKLFLRGTAYFKKGSYGQAITDFTEAIKLNPNWPEPYLYRAAAYEKIGDTAKSQADKQKYRELQKE